MKQGEGTDTSNNSNSATSHQLGSEGAPPHEEDDTSTKKKKGLRLAPARVLVVSLIAIVYVFIIMPTLPTAPPTQDWLSVIADILGISNPELLPESSAEAQALHWMAADDPLRDELRSRAVDGSSNREIVERYIIIVFYFSTNSPSWNEQLNFLTETSVCGWNNGLPRVHWRGTGVYCNKEGEVIKIQFCKF